MGERTVYGTADLDAPVTRAEFERAIRHLNLSDLDLRDAVLQMAARLVALTDELTRRIDGVEPEPAPPNTPAQPPSATVEMAVAQQLPEALRQTRAGDAAQPSRVNIDLGPNKYEVESAPVPCMELLHLCHSRCCTLSFSLSPADLDEGVIRWDYGQPYLIRQRASDGYCVHNDPETRHCTVHEHRPRVCRSYDCRTDERIWIDYEKRIPAAMPPPMPKPEQLKPNFDLLERARRRAEVIKVEKRSISETFAEKTPRVGPAPREK